EASTRNPASVEAISWGLARRNERCPQTRATASSRFVFPCAFSPAMTVVPPPKKTGSGERLRKEWVLIRVKRKRSFSALSQAHRHDDVEIARCPFDIPLGTAETLGVLVLHFQAHALRLRLFEEIEQVLGVQSDRHRLAVEAHVERLAAFTELLARGRDRQRILLEGELDA